MKKRLLALAIVLVMIISLLPVTAFAASPMPKLQMYDPNLSSKIDQYFNESRTLYVYFEDVVSADDPTVVLGNKPVWTTTAQSDKYIKCAFDGSVATITFKNVYYKRTANHSSPILQIVKNSGASGAFDVVFEFIGENYIEGNNAILTADNTGEVIITGPGSLEMQVSQSYKKGLIWGALCSQMTIRNANLNLVQQGASSARYGIVSAGDILIENSNVSITSDYGYCLATRSGTSVSSNVSNASLNEKSVTIRNSTFYGKVTGQTNSCAIQSYHITFENSNVYLTHYDTNTSTSTKSYSVLMKAPTIIGDYSVKQAAMNGYRGTVTWKDYDLFGLSPDDQLKRGETTGTLIRSINLEHKHTTTDCTKESTCTCQKVIPATDHTPGDEVIDTENREIVVSCTVCGTELSRTAAACIHETTEVIEGYAATCTTDGKTNGTKCASCGEILEEQETIPAAHTVPEGVEATCTTGVNCAICDVQVIAPKGHKVNHHYTGFDQYRYKYSIIPTCTEPGQSAYKSCSVCKRFFYWSYSADDLEAGKYTGFSDLKDMELYEAPFGHAAGEPVLDESTNEWVTSCTRCNEELSREADACKHANAVPGEAKDANCTEAGNTAGLYCPDCETWVEEQQVIDATGHTPVEDDGDCTTAVACSVCGKEAIAANDAHTPKGELTNCTKGVKCANCDQYAIEPTEGHVTSSPDRPCGTRKKCDICGQSWGAIMPHDEVKVAAKDATCVEAGHAEYWTCNNCDKVFSDAECTTVIEDITAWLAENGEGYIPATGHTPGAAADCENDQICTVCKVVLTEKLGHTEQIVEGKDATCTEDGLTDGIVCSVCKTIIKAQDVIKSEGHKYEAVVTAPTFDAKGYTTHTCSACGDSYVDSYVDALIAVATADGVKFETLQAAVNAGGAVELLANIETDAAILVNKTVVLNLNGFNVKTTEKDTAGDGVFHVVAGGDLTINDEGVIDGVGGNDWNIAIFADGGNVTINGGTYTNVGATDGGANTQFDLIYTKNGGTVTVNGGKFIAQTPAWTLNENDKNRGTIKVYGGEFFAFDPANNKTEGEGTNFLADQTEHTKEENGYYTICKETHKATVTAPTCTDKGYTTYECVCGDKYVADEVAALGHTEQTVEGKDATCTEDGLTDGIVCAVCKETIKAQDVIPAKGHTEQTVEGKDATCTEDGLTDGIVCSVCKTIIKAQDVIPAKGHTEQTVEGKDATCTEDGLTDGIVCTVCKETIKAQDVIPAKGHTEQIVEGKEATCTEEGLTDGIVCTVCKETIKAQEVIYVADHAYESQITAPTCNKAGLAIHTCSACGYSYEEVIPAKGHILEVVAVIAPTCNRGGYTQNKCTGCGGTFYTDETVAMGHNLEVTAVIAPTCNRGGYTTNTCTRCGGTFKTDETAAKGHNLEVTTVVAATCNRGGYTINTCTGCGGTFKTDETVAKGHNLEVTTVVAGTCNRGGYTIKTCTGCGGTFKFDEGAANGHTFTEKVKSLDYRKSAATATTGAIFYYACAECGESSEGYTDATWEYVNTAYTSKSIARIGDRYYNSLATAIRFADNGDVVVLLKAVVDGEAIVVNKNITIDFNNLVYTVSKAKNGAAIIITEGTEATLANGTVQLRYAARTNFNALVENNGTLKINNATLKGNALVAGAVLVKGNEVIEVA